VIIIKMMMMMMMMMMIPSTAVMTNGISDDTNDTTRMKLHDGLKES